MKLFKKVITSPYIRHILWLVVFASIFLLGLAMRSPEILAKNYLFGYDQGQNYMSAYHIFVEHKFTLIGAEVGSGSAGIPGLFHGPGFYYLLAFMMFFFGSNPYGGLVLMWIGGVATMLIVYFTTQKMFGTKTALAALFLISICPMIAPQARFVWGPHLGSVLIALYLYFLYKIKDKPILYAPLTALTAGSLYHFELALSVPLVFGLFAALIFVYRIFNKKVWVFTILACLAAFSMMLFFEARHGFMATHGLVKHLTQKKVESSKDKPAEDKGFFLAQKKYAFIANFRDSFVFEYGMIQPQQYMTALALMAGIIIFGIFLSKDRRIKQYFLALFCIIPVTIFIFLPLKNSVWPYYLIHLHFIYLYAFAYASVILVSRLSKSPFYVLPTILLVFFYVSFSQGTMHRLDLNWRVDYHDFGGKDKILGKKLMIDTMFADAIATNTKDFSVFVFMPPVYTYPYDYLFLTYAKEKYGYVPKQEKKGIAYMIIEVDWYKSWSYLGWLETVIKDGKPIWEKQIGNSDYILQKRDFGER
jgi:hypothetical protein